MFCQHMLNHIVLGQKCEKNIILVPSKKGFSNVVNLEFLMSFGWLKCVLMYHCKEPV